MKISYLEISLKSSIFRVFSNGIAPQPITLESCSSPQKNRQVSESAMKRNIWFRAFCEWRHKSPRFLAISAHVTWRRAQPLDGSMSLKFALEIWLDPESFETLIDFLAFLVQNLWPKNNKLINCLISGLITYFVDFIFCCRNTRWHKKKRSSPKIE